MCETNIGCGNLIAEYPFIH